MQNLYPFFISFILIFLSELGDKTQILVLSFATKCKTFNILVGIALGTFFSHGLAILFGSQLGTLNNNSFLIILKILTYITFLIFGILGFLKMNNKKEENTKNYKSKISDKIVNSSLNYIFVITISILLGEIGDKTFLSSLGLGVQYPNYKSFLIAGAILGMVTSNYIAIFLGKFISTKISDNIIDFISNIIFILFGIIGLIMFVLK